MDIAHPSTLLLPTAMTALIGWRMYSRIKRLVGRQRLSRVRPWITVTLFPLLVVLFALLARSHAYAVLALAGGAIAGIALGIYGHRLTKFEATPEGLFYTPNAHLGIALSVLLVARIAYRMIMLTFAPAAVPAGQATVASSPLTLLIFGTLAGYYVTYAIGLLRWRRQVHGRVGERSEIEPATEDA